MSLARGSGDRGFRVPVSLIHVQHGVEVQYCALLHPQQLLSDLLAAYFVVRMLNPGPEGETDEGGVPLPLCHGYGQARFCPCKAVAALLTCQSHRGVGPGPLVGPLRDLGHIAACLSWLPVL